MADLKALAQAIPGLNQQAQQRAQAAANVTLQQQLGAAPRQLPVRAASQQAGAAQATQAGQIAARQQQAQQQQLMQLGQQGLQQQQFANQAALQRQSMAQQEQLAAEKQQRAFQLTEAEIASRKRITDSDIQVKDRLNKIGLEYDNRLSILSEQQKRDLNRISQDAKDQIFDSRLAFEVDERGRKFSNQRQLADYTLMNAQKEEDFRQKAQYAIQANQRHMQLLQISYDKLSRSLQHSYKNEQAKLDYESQKKIAKLKSDMAAAMQRKQARANNNIAMWRTAGTVVGAVVGAYIGGSTTGGTGTAAGATAGASAGASVGGALGTMVGSANA